MSLQNIPFITAWASAKTFEEKQNILKSVKIANAIIRELSVQSQTSSINLNQENGITFLQAVMNLPHEILNQNDLERNSNVQISTQPTQFNVINRVEIPDTFPRDIRCFTNITDISNDKKDKEHEDN